MTIATRLFSNGSYFVNGSFDEITQSTIRVTGNTVYSSLFDETTNNGSTPQKRDNANGCIQVSGIFDEFTGAPVVDSSLVLWLDAGQYASYPETGSTWTDLSGRGNHGTLVSSPSFNISGYFNFNYTALSQISVGSTSDLQFLNRNPYTLEAWVYPTRNPGTNNWTGIVDRESLFPAVGGVRDGYNLFFLGSATTTTYFTTERFTSGLGTAVSYTIDQSLSVNAWQHIVATYDGTTLRLYHNGSSVGTPATSTGNISNNVKSLNIAVRGNNFFDGNISNIRIYNKTLTVEEINKNFNALRGRYNI